jgi:hypothetical protein
MNIVKIGKDVFPVASLTEAQAAWLSALSTYGWGASEAPRCVAMVNGERFRISYNGRAWKTDGSEVTASTLTLNP